MRDLNYAEGRRYSSRDFRRGATREILNAGSACPTVPKSGIWTTGGYKCYIDLHADEAISIAPLLSSASNSDIEDPDVPPVAPNGKKRDMAMWGG